MKDRENGMPDVIDRGSGPAVVFLHGAGVDNILWAPQIVSFERTHRVVAPNLPGHCGVPPVKSVGEMSDYVMSLLTTLEIEKFAVVGLSLGGMVALDIAGRWPHRVTHLAMIESVPYVADRPATRAFGKLAIGLTRLVPPALLSWLPPGQMGAETADAAKYLKETLPRGTARNTHRILQAALSYDGRSHFPQISMPTLVMVGEKNAATHKRAEEMSKAISGCTFLTVPGAGHIANRDAPNFVTTQLRSLLR